MVTAALLCTALLAAAAPPSSVLILPLEAKEGVTRDSVDQLAAAMAAHASTLPNLKVVTYREVESTLSQEQVRQVAGCGSVGCAAEIAGALNTNAIVIGSFGRFGADFLLTLSLVTARDATVVGRSVRRFPGKQMEAVLDAIPQIVVELFGKLARLDAARPPPQAAAAATPAPQPAPAPPPPATTPDQDDPDAKWAKKPAASRRRMADDVDDDDDNRATGRTVRVGMDPLFATRLYQFAAGLGGVAATLGAVGLSMCGLCVVGVLSGGVQSYTNNATLGLLLIGAGLLAGVLALFPFLGAGIMGVGAAALAGFAVFSG